MIVDTWPRAVGRENRSGLACLPWPSGTGVRRRQTVRDRSREPQDDARPPPADQQPAGALEQQGAGIFLITNSPAIIHISQKAQDQ